MREDVDGLALDSASHSDIGSGNATVPNRIGGHSSVGGISQASVATMHRPCPLASRDTNRRRRRLASLVRGC